MTRLVFVVRAKKRNSFTSSPCKLQYDVFGKCFVIAGERYKAVLGRKLPLRSLRTRFIH